DLAKQDFEAVLKLAEDKTITVEGVVLVEKDPDGEVHVTESGRQLGRRGLKLGGGVGLAVGLFAPPLLAATVVGAAAGGVTGKFAKHRLPHGDRGGEGDGQGRKAPARERDRGEDGRRVAARFGGRSGGL